MPSRLRPLRAALRDTFVLLREFRGSLFVLAATVFAGAALWQWLTARAGLEMHSFAEAAFVMLGMIFLQANVDFPDPWTLQVFFFILPLIGLGALARGAADFGVLLFNRKLRGEAWQEAVADTYSNHVILVGLGHLGFRVAQELHDLGQDVVAVERDPQADLLAAIQQLNIPIISGDATRPEVLEKAGIQRASAILLCSNSDVANLQIALKARTLRPDIRVLVRLFDEDFAREVQEHFKINLAFSASALAAPAIAGAAVSRMEVSGPIHLDGKVLNVGRFLLRPRSPLAGRTVREVEQQFDANVVMHRRGETVDLRPEPGVTLAAGDALAVLAEPQTLARIRREMR